MTHILVTGATGFVGRQVVRALVHGGAEVTAVVRTGSVVPQGLNKVVETGDIFAHSQDQWAEMCAGVDSIVHLAWYAEPGKYLHSPLNLNCLAGTLRFAEGAVMAGVKRFTGVGTCFEYALAGSVLTPESPLGPTTPYGAAKTAAYYGLVRHCPLTETEFAWCRLFYLYGEGEDERRLIPYLHSRFRDGLPAELTSGTQVRDFMNVREAGSQIARVALGEGSGALNICSGNAVTVGEIALSIAERYGRPDLVRLGAKADRPDDPAFVLGQPSLKPEIAENLSSITAPYAEVSQ